MSRIYGLVTGLVIDVDDPDEQGRVQVSLPWLGGDDESFWAPVATLMSGNGRGSWFMPEVDDEVLVAFEHGDVDHPFVIGYLWNGVDRPPSAGGHSVRRLRTVSGHVLEFHDEDDGRKILLRTAGEQQVELDDTASSVVIETSGHERVELSPGTLKASTPGGQSVELDDAPLGVTVKAGPGTIRIDANGVTVTHPGRLTVNAPIATFSGIVTATTVVATHVVGASYTPAPGNTFGL